MKSLLDALFCFFLGVILLGCRTHEPENQQGMEFDKHISITEVDVRVKYGEPIHCGVYPVREFLDELHRPIYRKYSPNRLDTGIKEMYYEMDGFQLFFWLEKKHLKWRVVGDAKFPKGIRF